MLTAGGYYTLYGGYFSFHHRYMLTAEGYFHLYGRYFSFYGGYMLIAQPLFLFYQALKPFVVVECKTSLAYLQN